MPWRWYSLDGTGWCYDTAWDELRRCEDVAGRIDWNGVSDDSSAVELGLPTTEILFVVAVGCSWAARRAYLEWVACEQRRMTDEEKPHEPPQDAARVADDETDADYCAAPSGLRPSLDEWLRSGRAWPWRWERREARLSLLASVFGVMAALWLPLPMAAGSPPPSMDGWS